MDGCPSNPNRRFRHFSPPSHRKTCDTAPPLPLSCISNNHPALPYAPEFGPPLPHCPSETGPPEPRPLWPHPWGLFAPVRSLSVPQAAKKENSTPGKGLHCCFQQEPAHWKGEWDVRRYCHCHSRLRRFLMATQNSQKNQADHERLPRETPVTLPMLLVVIDPVPSSVGTPAGDSLMVWRSCDRFWSQASCPLIHRVDGDSCPTNLTAGGLLMYDNPASWREI